MSTAQQTGPLSGCRVIELAGIGPGPYCAHLLADLGAEVIIIDRPGGMPYMVDGRGKKSMVLDLRKPEAVDAVLKLVETADVLTEGYRPGVAERLGLGPDVCLQRNPKLVYGRMTGWGQDGPWASMAGHDINYLSITGFLSLLGKKNEAPSPPINLVGDYGGGSLFLAMGILSALFKAQKTGQGDVVDAAIIDGVSSMLGIIHSLSAFGQWTPERNNNLLDGGAPFYRCYETSDGKYMAVGCIEPQFFTEMLQILGVSPADYGNQHEKTDWPRQHVLLDSVFRLKTRDAWAALFDGTDACVTPVLNMAEAQHHPHNKARNSHVNKTAMTHPHPAPRLQSMDYSAPLPIPQKGADTVNLLRAVGCSEETIKTLT